MFYLFLVLTHFLCSLITYYLVRRHFERKKAVMVSEKDYFDERTRNPDLLYKSLTKYYDKEKPYLTPNLTVNDVARELMTNRTYLSRAIRQNHMINFNYFTNSYRVREAAEIFDSNPMARVSDVSVMSGFNTPASFTMSFKMFLNMTPKQWKDSHQATTLASSGEQEVQLRVSKKRSRRRRKDTAK